MIYVGTAAWTIPSQFKRFFPDGDSQLERYAQRLTGVEINSSFKRRHRVQTYERWSANVPSHFRFSVKVPHALTHVGGLAPNSEALEDFAAEVAGLGNKLGVLLVQLPPKLAFDERLAGRFFRTLRNRTKVPLACEPRHASWGSPQVDRLLERWEVARVAADPAPWVGAGHPGGYRRLAYYRWHGQPRKYYSDYGAEALSLLRAQVAASLAAEVWVIFDNTVMGCASGNALWMDSELHPQTSA